MRWSVADLVSMSRLPLGVAFALAPSPAWRGALLALAGLSDLLDGWVARHLGASSRGPFLDPVVDKLFMGCAFGAVLLDGALGWVAIIGCLFRDIVLSAAWFLLRAQGRSVEVPSRASGKAVTLCQLATLAAFVVRPAWLPPLATLTTAAAGIAVLDYTRITGVGRTPRPIT